MTALFANFDFFKQNIESAKSSLGALNEQNEIYLDSIDAKLDQLGATADSIKFDLFMGTDWGNVIDALNTILKGVRGLVDDFGGLSGILVTTGALLTKTFAPKLITDFATKFAKMRNDWKELEKKPFINLGTANENYFSSSKSTVQFFTNALEKGTTEAKDNIRIMNSILQSGGKEALQTYEQISEKIQNVIKQRDSYVTSALERASRNNNNNVNLFESGNLFNSSENRLGTDIDVSSIVSISGTLDDAMKNLGISSKDAMTIMEQFGSMIEQNIPTNKAFNQIINLITESLEKSSPQFRQWSEQAKQAAEQGKEYMASMEKMQKVQKTVSAISAVTIGIQGLVTVVEKANDGDIWGAFTSGALSLGSALMMINPIAGAVVTGIGTVMSALGSYVDQTNEKTREHIRATIEQTENYAANAKQLQELSNTYSKLQSKQSLTADEQNELNSTIESLGSLLGGDNELVAYYDESGKAVYKTTAQVQELIDKWKEEQKAAADANIQAAQTLATDDKTSYNNTRDKLQQNKQTLNELNKDLEALKSGLNDDELNALVDRYSLGAVEYFGSYEQQLQYKAQQMAKAITDGEGKLQDGFEDLNNLIDTEFATFDFGDNDNANLFAEKFKSLITDGLSKGTIESAANIDTNIETILNYIQDGLNDKSLDMTALLSGNKDAVSDFKEGLKKLTKNNPELNDMADILDTMIDSWENNADAANEAADASERFSGTIGSWDSELSGFKGVIDDAKSALEEFAEKSELSYDTMISLNSAFGDVSGYEEFVNQLASGAMTSEQFKAGIEQLISTYYSEKVALEGVTDENKAQLEMMLNSLGVTNSAQIANQALANEIIAQGNAALAAGEDTSQYDAALEKMGYKAVFSEKAIYQLELQMIAANDTGMDFSSQIAAIEKVGNAALKAGYNLQFMMSAAGAQDMKKRLMSDYSVKGKLAYGMTEEKIDQMVVDSMMQNVSDKINSATKNIDIDVSLPPTTTTGGGGGGGGSSSKEKDYEATIDKYEKKTKAIEELEREISDLNNEVSDTESLLEKNDLLEKTNKLLEQEKELQLDLNNARDKEIAQNVQQLKSIGFDIEYDPEQDKLLINNKEHINDLTATGDKTTSEYRKEIEGLIKDTESLNDSNQDAVDKFKELNRQIEKNNKAIKENAYNDFKNQQDDILFNTIFYENLESGTSKVREIYLEVFNNWQAKLDEMIAKGMTLADDEVQEAIKKLYDLQDKIDDASDQIYENQKDRIDDLLDFFSTASPKAISLVGKKIDLTNQQIAENLEKGTEESINKAIELYQELWKYQKQALELQKELLEQQKDDYDDVISAVTGAIDKEIDKLKEEQEALKEQNEEREKEIELMKLKAALELAQSQKTILVYHKNQGFVWEADQEAIDEAKKNLNEFYADQEQDEIQKRIDALEKYKDKWSSIPDDIEQAENEIKAAEILGSDWQSKIFNMREDIVAEFGKNYKTTYDGIKQLDEQINNGYTPIVEKIEELIAKLAELQEQAEETANSMNFDTGYSKSYYANANGQAPTGLKTGDTVTTMGGTYVVSTTDPEQEGWGYNKDSGYWSKLLGTTEEIQKRLAAQDSARLNGSQVMQPELLQAITETLQEEMPELLTATNEGLSSTTTELKTLNEISLDKISTDFKNYSSSIEKAINNTDASAKNAKASASWASDSASDAARSAADAERYAQDAARSARDAASSASDAASSASSQSDSVEVHHRGIDSGLAGSPTKVENNLFELANGGLKEDEVLSVLQKGETIFTSKQLATLGQSVNSLVLLNDLQQKQLQIGLTQGFNNNINSAVPREGNNISFGDININMTGVENQEQFSSALKNNIKSIFAQAVAGI